MIYEHLPMHREFRLAMTDEERANHQTGWGVALVNGRMQLNTTVTLAADRRWQPTRCIACGAGLRADGFCSRCAERLP